MLSQSCKAQTAREDPWAKPRAKLLKELREQGIDDKAVLAAMDSVPRHEFVPAAWRKSSYENRPLPIGHDQTISQPFIVAYMSQALELKPGDKVLEIGAGSGYHAAVMSRLASRIFTIEIVPALGESAAKLLKRLGYDNIAVRIGDGYRGWPEEAPFDAICITAAPPEVPQPLLDQLKIGGRLIAPVGENWQKLVLVRRTPDGYEQHNLIPVLFVPMTGEAQDKK
ncbi:MAG: protein-L-isoaspartate(D-aspartate) O-methyltransferase [Calditrichaeota bacterium]|nr:protein-L-isoaspartate(D-aspartate) O-methyltransferase [Calditrichota bacterium]